jgi:hypothetical protein
MRALAWQSVAAAGLVCALAAGIPACNNDCSESDSATCFPAPNEQIVGFHVTVKTDDDPTTSDVFFCYQRKSTAGWSCKEMDHGGFHNDYQSGETDHYKLSLQHPIAPGDFERFRLAMEESNNHHDWNLAQLTVVAVTAGGRKILVYHDEDIDCPEAIDEGQSYWPRECPY